VEVRAIQTKVLPVEPSPPGDGNEGVGLLEVSALVAGTAVGGGFLALPLFVAPAGFVPGAAAIAIVWVLLCCNACLMAEAYTLTRMGGEHEGGDISLFSIVSDAMGGTAAKAVSAVLLLLVNATLTAQLQLGATLLNGFGIAPAFGAGISSLFCAAIVFGAGERAASKVNAAATLALVASFVGLLLCAAPLGNPELLSRASWPLAFVALPGLLQLLTFGEVVPTVCSLLEGNIASGSGEESALPEARKALVVGSAVPATMALLWCALACSFPPGGDPLAGFLQGGDLLVRAASNGLGVFGLFTTGVAGYLALSRLLNDALLPVLSASARKVAVPMLTCLPSLAVAVAAPGAMVAVISFSGSGPVLLLHGLVPPAVLLLLRRRWPENSRKISTLASPTIGALGVGAALLMGFLLCGGH